jgi:hypothetical protein
MQVINDDFKDNGWIVDDFVFTFEHAMADDLKKMIEVKYFETTPTLSDEFIFSQIKNIKNLGNGAPINNVFKAYYTNKLATEYICNLEEKYDFVLMTRMDTTFSIKSNYNLWFNEGKYTTIGTIDRYGPHKHAITKDFNENPFTCDQFGVAPPLIMKDAWDYKNIENLNRFVENSYRGEDPMDHIIEMNKVPLHYTMADIHGWPDKWIQNKDRRSIQI